MIPDAVQAKLQAIRDAGASPLLAAAFEEVAELAVRETARDCIEVVQQTAISLKAKGADEFGFYSLLADMLADALRARYGLTDSKELT